MPEFSGGRTQAPVAPPAPPLAAEVRPPAPKVRPPRPPKKKLAAGIAGGIAAGAGATELGPAERRQVERPAERRLVPKHGAGQVARAAVPKQRGTVLANRAQQAALSAAGLQRAVAINAERVKQAARAGDKAAALAHARD